MADVIIGASLQADDQISPKVKNIKQELRAAQDEVVRLSEKFGSTSKEAAAAADKAAKLKDAIGDARSLVDAFNPDTKFRAFGAAINTVTGGFTALTGAMALLGVESEDVQKTLLKVQSALAISQGVAQLQEGIQSFRNLKSVLIDTLGKNGAIGLAIAGVAALGYAIWDSVTGTNKLADSEKELAKSFVAAKKEMSLLANTISQAKQGLISKDQALKAYNDSLGKVTGRTNDLETAERLMAENADKYVQVQSLKAQANFLLQQSAEKSAQAELMRQQLLEADLPRFLKKNIEKQIQSDLDGLKVYDTAVKDINDRIKAVKFSVTTSGLGSSFGAGDKKNDTKDPVSINKQNRENEINTDINFWQTKLGIDLTNRQTLADNALMMRRILLDAQSGMDDEELSAAQEQYYALRQAEDEHNAAMEAAQQIAFDNKMKMMQAVASGLSSLSDLVGRETAAGKVMAAAGATIDTYAAIAKQLKVFSGVPIPGYAIAQAIATGIFGLVQVKKILSTPVPGKGSGGGSAPSISSVTAPLQAQLPQSSTTRLDQGQLNQIGNATVRAFVVESDVSNNQDRIRRLNRAARLG